MKCLVLIAHGSRRAASNQEVQELAQRVQAQAGERFAKVESAFLELAEPSIPDAIDACVAQGATEIVIVPYFLSAGRHVAEDVPALVKERSLHYPQVRFEYVKHLGAANEMALFILQHVPE
ncbi:sirohydrochlorin chelatase [Thiolinea disciformis]|uniref:sirohydrochlorin chelatase n=1 Tax=Thiolinea disciformis TaxID=125614 RepID=UPI0003754525|nr:CbiX/SirB N-terminal domain-containing protein [Thiolinea disciformis]